MLQHIARAKSGANGDNGRTGLDTCAAPNNIVNGSYLKSQVPQNVMP